MARKPVNLTHAAGHVSGRDAIWAAIRKLRRFTYADLSCKTNENEHTIRTYLAGLDRAGIIRKIGADHRDDSVPGIIKPPARYRAAVYELVTDVGVDAPRVRRNGGEVTQGRGREQLWRTIKILRDFDYQDLAISASTEQRPITPSDARDYVKHLHKAGYLAMISPANPAGGLARYRLLPSKYTGPRPPMVQRIKQVFDPNLGRVVWPTGGEA